MQLKALLRLAAKMTRESYKIIPEDIATLRGMGFSDEVILEGIHTSKGPISESK